MATIITKKSSTGSAVPSASDLQVGELAVNTADAKLYTKHGSSVVEIGNTEVSSDTTPVLGGNLDTGSNAVGTGDAAIKFDASSNQILPWDLGDNAAQPSSLSLGSSTNRFQTLYLNGNFQAKTGCAIGNSGQNVAGLTFTSYSSSATVTSIAFRSTNSQVGSITHHYNATQYNTSSDYRLKEDIQEVPNATARTLALKPCNFQWIGTEHRVDGFLAHELAEQVPESVTGEKDAVDADGNPEYQAIDQSKLVPLLVKTIQELEARITTLENA